MRRKTTTLERVLCAVALCTLLFSCSSDDEDLTVQETIPTRTVLAYMIAENSLSSAAVSDVNEMLAAATYLGEGDHLIVYIDNTTLPRIYDITANETATTMSALTPVMTYEEDLNSASAEVLQDIIAWTLNNYPADSYGLILWSHGTGWLPNGTSDSSSSSASSPKRKTFGVDNESNTTSNSGSTMNLSDLADALEQGPQWEFILSDACFMQSFEIAYELQDYADWLIASPAEIPYDGAPYNTVVPTLFNTTFDAETTVDAYLEAYTGCLLSAIDCSLLNNLAASTASLLLAYEEEILAMDLSNVLNYFDYDAYGTQLPIPDCYDPQGVLLQVATTEELTNWQSVRTQVVYAPYKSSWYSAYPARYLSVDEDQYSGLALFLPLDKYNSRHAEFITAYRQTRWGQYVGW